MCRNESKVHSKRLFVCNYLFTNTQINSDLEKGDGDFIITYQELKTLIHWTLVFQVSKTFRRFRSLIGSSRH